MSRDYRAVPSSLLKDACGVTSSQKVLEQLRQQEAVEHGSSAKMETRGASADMYTILSFSEVILRLALREEQRLLAAERTATPHRYFHQLARRVLGTFRQLSDTLRRSPQGSTSSPAHGQCPPHSGKAEAARVGCSPLPAELVPAFSTVSVLVDLFTVYFILSRHAQLRMKDALHICVKLLRLCLSRIPAVQGARSSIDSQSKTDPAEVEACLDPLYMRLMAMTLKVFHRVPHFHGVPMDHPTLDTEKLLQHRLQSFPVEESRKLFHVEILLPIGQEEGLISQSAGPPRSFINTLLQLLTRLVEDIPLAFPEVCASVFDAASLPATTTGSPSPDLQKGQLPESSRKRWRVEESEFYIESEM